MGNSPLASEPVAAREPGNDQTRAAALSDSEDESSYQEIYNAPPPTEPPEGAGGAGTTGEDVI